MGGRLVRGGLGPSRRTTTSFFSSFNPALSSNLRFSYTQPLLRNLRIDAARQQVTVATTNWEIADLGLRQTIASTERSVRNAYWDLVFAIAFLDVQRQSLELAEESLRNNRARVEVGTMEPIDIVEAEAEVARNQEAVILAEAQLARGGPAAHARPGAGGARLLDRAPPADGPAAPRARPIDVDEAIRTAIERRTDVDQLRQADREQRYQRPVLRQRLPDRNLFVDYSVAGLGGRRFLREPGFPGPVIGEQNYAFGDLLGDLLGNDFPSWQVGPTIGYPLGRSTADANLARARLERSQTEARLREIEIRVVSEVRDAARRVTTGLQRVEATCRIARELAERRLEAEQRRFDVPCRRASSSSRRNATSPWRGTTSSSRPSTTWSRSSISRPCRRSRSSEGRRPRTV